VPAGDRGLIATVYTARVSGQLARSGASDTAAAVNAVWQVFFGGPPAPAEEDFWAAELTQPDRRRTRAAVRQLLATPGAVNFAVGEIFANVLVRLPTEAETRYFVHALNSGVPEEHVWATLLATPEYVTKYVGPEDDAETYRRWLDRVGQDVLGKILDEKVAKTLARKMADRGRPVAALDMVSAGFAKARYLGTVRDRIGLPDLPLPDPAALDRTSYRDAKVDFAMAVVDFFLDAGRRGT
jgi:hypothetical protein